MLIISTSYFTLFFFCTSDANKFFDYAKKYIEYLKKQIDIPTTTTNEQNNPFRTQLVQLCKDIAEDKRLQINQEDERIYRLLAIETLSPVKTIPPILNEFVRIIREERSKIYIIPYLPF